MLKIFYRILIFYWHLYFTAAFCFLPLYSKVHKAYNFQNKFAILNTRGTDEKDDKEATVEYSPFKDYLINKFIPKIILREDSSFQN